MSIYYFFFFDGATEFGLAAETFGGSTGHPPLYAFSGFSGVGEEVEEEVVLRGGGKKRRRPQPRFWWEELPDEEEVSVEELDKKLPDLQPTEQEVTETAIEEALAAVTFDGRVVSVRESMRTVDETVAAKRKRHRQMVAAALAVAALIEDEDGDS